MPDPIDISAPIGQPVFIDSGDPQAWTTFSVLGGSTRAGYRVGYVAGNSPLMVQLGSGALYRITGTPNEPTRVKGFNKGDTQDQLADLMSVDGTTITFADDAVLTLTKPLPKRGRNVRWINARVHLKPADHGAFVYIDCAPGFRVEGLSVTAEQPWKWDKAHKGTADVFHVNNGGSLVCRGKVSVVGGDTFCKVQRGATGVVIEAPDLKDIREYALYQDGSDAGVSFWRGKIDAFGNEPFIRVHDYPDDSVVASNVYVGFNWITRRDPRNPWKDGITPRGCKRVALDTNFLERCQIRAGQDDQGVKDGGKDPTDILTIGNTVEDSYYDHKKGLGKSARIFVIGNTFVRPLNDKPVMYSCVTDGAVTDNVWDGGPATWEPETRDLTNCRIENNTNGNPPVDPAVEAAKVVVKELDAKIAEMRLTIQSLELQRAEWAAKAGVA